MSVCVCECSTAGSSGAGAGPGVANSSRTGSSFFSGRSLSPEPRQLLTGRVTVHVLFCQFVLDENCKSVKNTRKPGSHSPEGWRWPILSICLSAMSLSCFAKTKNCDWDSVELDIERWTRGEQSTPPTFYRVYSSGGGRGFDAVTEMSRRRTAWPLICVAHAHGGAARPAVARDIYPK